MSKSKSKEEGKKNLFAYFWSRFSALICKKKIPAWNRLFFLDRERIVVRVCMCFWWLLIQMRESHWLTIQNNTEKRKNEHTQHQSVAICCMALAEAEAEALWSIFHFIKYRMPLICEQQEKWRRKKKTEQPKRN